MQEKVKLFFVNNWPYLILSALSIILPQIWLAGDFLFVSEERLFINYQVLIPANLYSWTSAGYGSPAAIWNHTLLVPNAILFHLLSYLGLSNYLIQKIFLSLVLFLIFVAIAYLLKIFTKNKLFIFLGAFFYAFNFYTLSIHFYTARMFQLILMPLFFVFLFKYLDTKNYKYAVYNFFALLFLQAIFCNLPQLLATFFVYVVAIAYYIIVKQIKVCYFFREFSKKLIYFFLLLAPIIIYHSLINYFSFIVTTGGFDAVRKAAFFKAIGSKLYLLFQLRGSWWEYLGWQGITYNHWLSFYDSKIVIISLYIAILPIFINLCYHKKNKREHFLFYVTLIVFMLLTSGSSFYPSIYNWMYENIPFFSIFREPWAKFMPLLLMNIIILLVISLRNINSRMVAVVILLSVVIQARPFFSYNFFDHLNKGWKRVLIQPPDYWYEYKTWTAENKGKSILVFPIFQAPIDYLRYNWYSGDLGNANNDALLYQIFSYANNINFDIIDKNSQYKSITQSFRANYNNDFIKLGTIDYILYQSDLDYAQMRILAEKQSGIRSYFQEKPIVSFGNKLFLYKIRPEYFLPHIYTPKNFIIADGGIDSVPKIVARQDYQLRSAIYFREQSKNLPPTLSAPNVEFKKINPTKYLVRVHRAIGSFSLIFGDSFNESWELYLKNYRLDKIDNNQLDGYQILNGNEGNQANKEELGKYIKQGLVSTLGDGKEKEINHKKWENGKEELDYIEKYKIDFISKNFQGTIQNDNMPKGKFYETWLAGKLEEEKKGITQGILRFVQNDNVKQLSDENHLMANGYANSWLIETDKICSQTDFCQKNPDGTYNFELVVEYWPQRLFYIGLSISGATLFGCIAYLAVDYARRRKKRSLVSDLSNKS